LPEARRLAVVYLERAQDGLARASGLASQEDRLPNIVNLIRFVMCREGTLDAAQRTAEVIARAETLLLGAKRIDDANSGVTEGLVAQNHQYAEQFIGYAAEMWLIAASGVVASERRKALFDRVQQIVWDEAPFLYLVNRNALVAASRSLRGVEPSPLRPNILWNAERLWIEAKQPASAK